MNKNHKIILVIGLLALVGFLTTAGFMEEESPSPASAHSPSKSWSLQNVGSRIKDIIDKNEAKTPDQPEVQEVKLEYQDPIWPASSTIDWELRAKLSKELLNVIDQSPVPILVPSEAKYLEGATMVGTNYGFSREGKEPLSLSILAYEATTSTIPVDWQREVRGMPASGPAGVLRYYNGPQDIADGSWHLQWRENNIYYFISLTCFPSTCLGEPDLFDIANSLRYVGGKHALGGTE